MKTPEEKRAYMRQWHRNHPHYSRDAMRKYRRDIDIFAHSEARKRDIQNARKPCVSWRQITRRFLGI